MINSVILTLNVSADLYSFFTIVSLPALVTMETVALALENDSDDNKQEVYRREAKGHQSTDNCAGWHWKDLRISH